MAEMRPASVAAPAAPVIADPAPLGLAGFALTTFVLSGHAVGFIPDLIWVGLAIFYGGMAQFLAGMWEFRRGNTFASTAFSSYGAFWLSLGVFVLLILFGKIPTTGAGAINVTGALAWFFVAFFIFNLYMLIASTRVNMAVFAVFLTLGVTEGLVAIGYFSGNAAGHGWLQIGGIVGLITAAVAWYTSFAGVVNALAAGVVMPVGAPMMGAPLGAATTARPESPLPRQR